MKKLTLAIVSLALFFPVVGWTEGPSPQKVTFELIQSTIETIAHRSAVAEEIIEEIRQEGGSPNDIRLVVALESVEALSKATLKLIHRYDLPR